MIADALRAEVERYAAGMDRHNPLFVATMQGRLQPDAVVRYLTSVRHLVQHTPTHLARAHRRALGLGDKRLANHYAEKIVEECGHDAWADRDLGQLRSRFKAAPASQIAPGLISLLRYLEQAIDQEPTVYLAYILFAEYLIVLRGPEWLALLEERCGIPPRMMSVIGNHAELDREHTAEGLAAIDRLVSNPAMLQPMRETMRHCMALFDEFCAQVVFDHSALDATCIPISAA